MYNTNSQLLIQSARRTSAVSCPSIGGKQAKPGKQPTNQLASKPKTVGFHKKRTTLSGRVSAAIVVNELEQQL